MGRIVSQQPRQKKGSRRSAAGRPQAVQSVGKTHCKILSSKSGMVVPLFLGHLQVAGVTSMTFIVGTRFFVL